LWLARAEVPVTALSLAEESGVNPARHVPLSSGGGAACCDQPRAGGSPLALAAAPALLASHNAAVLQKQEAAGQKPNILVIWGDDIGQFNVSAYNLGMMGFKTPNIDRIAREGALFTDWYGQQSCTAGRAGVHYRAISHPHRTDQSRAPRCPQRDEGRRPHHRHPAAGPRLCDGTIRQEPPG
jgi:hypothetical protein